MGLFGKLFGGFIEKRNPEFCRTWSINSCINMCGSMYEDFSRKIPNKDPHEYLVWVCRDMLLKSGTVSKSAVNEPNFVWDLIEATLKPACLPPPICARALAYYMILRDDEFSLGFATKDDFKTYHDEYIHYLKPLMRADRNPLKDHYCKYNKNVQHQQTMFGSG
jgi:hypothetical protein